MDSTIRHRTRRLQQATTLREQFFEEKPILDENIERQRRMLVDVLIETWRAEDE